MVTELAAVKADFLDPCGLCPLRNGFANRFGSLLVAAESDRISQLLVDRARRNQRPPGSVVDDLGVNVLVGAEHRQTGAIRRTANIPTDAVATANPLPKNRTGVVHGSVTAEGGG